MSNFWSNQTVAPKRSYRFLIEIGGQAVWWAKSVSTPSFDIGEIEHSFLGGKYYFPGKVSWTEVSMTLVDPVNPDAVGFTNSILAASGYVVPKLPLTDVETATVDKIKSNQVLNNLAVNIIVIDSAGVELEKWTLNQAFLRSAKYGDLSYEDENLRTVELTWRYDWATCEFGGEHNDANLQSSIFFGVGSAAAGDKDYYKPQQQN